MKNKTAYFILFGLVALFFSLVIFFKKNTLNERLLEAMRRGCTTTVQDCIDRGADITMRDETGWTPLHYAAIQDSKQIVEILIKNGAAINVRDETGTTPLHNAAGLGHREIVTILLDNGAEVDATNEIELTPLKLAKGGGHKEVEAILLRYGAKNEEILLTDDTRNLKAELENGYKEMIDTLVKHNAIT